MLEMGVIQKVNHVSGEILSNIFTREKKEKGQCCQKHDFILNIRLLSGTIDHMINHRPLSGTIDHMIDDRL